MLTVYDVFRTTPGWRLYVWLTAVKVLTDGLSVYIFNYMVYARTSTAGAGAGAHSGGSTDTDSDSSGSSSSAASSSLLGSSSGSGSSAIEEVLTFTNLLLAWFCVRMLNKLIVEFFYLPCKAKFDAELLLNFRNDALEDYQLLNFPTRKVETLSTCLPRYRKAQNFVKTLNGAGVNAFINLFRALFDAASALTGFLVVKGTIAVVLVTAVSVLYTKARHIHELQRQRRQKEEVLLNKMKMEVRK
jgi:hypothetical protein